MIEAILHLFKIHREMVLGNPAVVVEDMLGVAPESLNPVDVVLAMIRKRFTMVEPVMFSQPLQGIVTPEGVGVVDRSFPRMLPDMRHEFIGGNPLHDFGVHPSIPLQKAKYDGFACRTPSALALASAPKVCLVNLDLALQSACFQLSHMIYGLTQTLVDAGYHLVVKSKVACHAIRRLLLVESGDDGDLLTQSFQRLLFSTVLPATLYIPSSGLYDPKRTAEDALSASQKVGRTVENVLFASNHEGIVDLRGYESH